MVELDTHIDDKSKRFLQAVEWHNDSATTTEIRERTGLNQSETQYRFKKLSDAGLIKISRAEQGYGQRRAPRVAELTSKAKSAIEEDLLNDIDTTTATGPGSIDERTVEQLREDVERLEEQLELLAHAGTGTGRSPTASSQPSVITNRFDAFEERLTELEDEITAITDLTERVTTLEEDMTRLRGYTYELADEFEIRMAAAQSAIEDQLNVDVTVYRDRLESQLKSSEERTGRDESD